MAKNIVAKYIIMVGPPGAGKGTQAAKISEVFKMPHVASGDLFRDNLKRQTDLGVLAKTYMDKGELVPDDVTIKMVLERLGRPDCSNGAILDGFPRTVSQAEALDKALAEQGVGVAIVPLVTVEDEALVKRLSGRRICRSCGATYHILYNAPKKANVCDQCSGELYQRDDDKEETIKNRLKVYWQQTSPLIDYFKKQGLLEELNGDQPIEDIQNILVKAIKNRIAIV
jgi:adenylate kinase